MGSAYLRNNLVIFSISFFFYPLSYDDEDVEVDHIFSEDFMLNIIEFLW